MGALITNEWLKLIKRKISWVMPIVIVLGVLLMAIMTQRENKNWIEYVVQDPEQNNYEFNGGIMAYELADGTVISEYEFWQQEDVDPETAKLVNLSIPETISELENQLTKLERIPKPTWENASEISYLKKEIEYYQAYDTAGVLPPDSRQGSTTSASFFSDLGGLYLVPTLIVVIVASLMIATEFSGGTIKLLLTRPYTRTQILLSKYVVTIIYSGILSLVLIVSALAFAQILPAQSLTLPFSVESGGKNALTVAISLLLSNFLLMMFYMSIAFFFSAIIRSQALAVGVGMMFLFSGSILGQILPSIIEKYKWLKWIIFNLLNLNSRVTGQIYEISDDLSNGAVVVGLIAYTLVIIVATIVMFNKRDVALS